MARVTDLLSTLGVAEDGITTAYPDTFIDDINGAYGEDTAAYEAKIQVLSADLAAAQQKVIELQAHNYELMTSVSATPNVEGEGEEESGEDEPEDNDDNSGIDSLFSDKKDDE